jgi:hypothetical protein
VENDVSGKCCVKHQRETLCDAEALWYVPVSTGMEMYVFESQGEIFPRPGHIVAH